MQLKIIFALVLVVLPMPSLGGYCNTYVRTSYRARYYVSCGFWGWRSCPRYRTVFRSTPVPTCCNGYSGAKCDDLKPGFCNDPSSSNAKCCIGYSGNNCLDIDECSSTRITNGGCSQICTNTPGYYKCSCRSGYKAKGKSCTDINECLTGNGQCAHICTNSVGSYECSCNDGHTLELDKHNCTNMFEGGVCTTGDMLMYPKDCSKFLQCDQGSFALKQCPTGTRFNNEAGSCDHEANVHCQGDGDDSDLAGDQSIIAEGGPCEAGDMYRDPADCSKYLTCLHGQYLSMQCPSGTRFNNDAGTCDNEANVPCENPDDDTDADDADPAAGEDGDEDVPETTPEIAAGGPCNADDMYRDPADCSRYLMCLHGTYLSMPCGPGTRFNNDKKACDLAANVSCP